jgi:hypothetical protein
MSMIQSVNSLHMAYKGRHAKSSDVLRFRARTTYVNIESGNSMQNNAHFDISSSTGFPVSKTVDKRLLANTSGETSMNM